MISIKTFDVISNTKNDRWHLDEGDEVETSGPRNEVPGDAVGLPDNIIGRGVQQIGEYSDTSKISK